MAHTHRVQTAQQLPQDSRMTAASLPSKAQQRDLFRLYRAAGHSVLASSRKAGINRSTGARWDVEDKRNKAEQELAHPEQIAERAAIATKAEIAEQLTKSLYAVEPKDVPSVAATLNRMMGFDAPTVTRQEVIIGSFDQYIEHLEREELKALQASQVLALPASSTGVEPPIQERAESVTHPPNISQNGEK